MFDESKDVVALKARADIPYQKLVIGPDYHTSGSMTGESFTLGEKILSFPSNFDDYTNYRAPDSMGADLYRRWYAHWLKDEDSGLLNEAPVTLFVQGDNQWRDEQEWPLARTQYTPFYLGSEQGANSIEGDGTLSENPPSDGEATEDSYVYDPANPVPSKGGTFVNLGIPPGMFDQGDVETRDDVLVYSSSPIERDMEVTGPISLKLWVSTSAVDTDFTARVVDVEPDGKTFGICDGVNRLRFRDDQPGLVEPGSVQEIEVELSPTSYVFKSGHRIRVQVSSSNYPLIDINPNTGKSLLADKSNEMIVAQQTVYHDSTRASHILLPVIPR